MSDEPWDWPDALAVLTRWDCPSDHKVYYFVDIGSNAIRIILENETGKTVSFALRHDRSLQGLHAALDAILVQMRCHCDYYSFSNSLKRQLGRAGKTFEKRLNKHAPKPWRKSSW